MAKEHDKTDDAIVAAIAVLSETYTPATNLQDCSRKFTTAQVVEAIAELTGKRVSQETVYEAMTAEGYKYQIDETSSAVKYVWLLNYR